MLTVGIVGASGYTGVELARILAGHPEIRLTVATSRQYAGRQLAAVITSIAEYLQGITNFVIPFFSFSSSAHPQGRNRTC